MNKLHLFLVSTFIACFTCAAQNDFSQFWNELLSNNRTEAARTLKKSTTSDLEWLVTNELLRVETGKIERNKRFLEEFLNEDDFEYYLNAFWTEPFIFDSYLDDGFNAFTYEALEKISSVPINHIDLKDAISYITAIGKRHRNDWEAYDNFIGEINCIRDWQYCGSFENLNNSGLDKVYEPETNSNNETIFDARSNGRLKWYNGVNEKEAYQFFSNHNEYGSSVNYAQTFINSEIDQRIIVRVGSGSAFKIFLNDVEFYKYDKDVSTDLNAYEVFVNLPKGNNRLLIKTAESNSTSYFLVSLFDEFKKPLQQISVNKMPSAYNKSTLETLDPVEKENDFEAFFKDKIETNPENFLYAYALYKTYLRNSKYNEARDVLMPFYKKYPKSSLLRRAFISTYNIEKDYTSSKELSENIERDDPDYFLPIINKISESNELSRLSMDEYEDFIEKLKSTFDSELIKAAANFLYQARKEDIAGLKASLETLNGLADKYDNTNFKLKYAPLFDQIFQDKDRTISTLEGIVKSRFNLNAENQLITYYENKNEKDKVLALIDKHYGQLKTENAYLTRLTNKFIEYQMFKEALPYTDQMLKNYPYSFSSMELRGDVLKQLGQTKEALEYYNKALEHNSSDASLRKKINDISKKPNLLKDLVSADAYDYIGENRKQILSNNYGFNILLDDSNIELFKEGGFKYRYVYIYEITSDSGIETFKEYNLGLSGSYKFLKSELVKPSGNIVPADRQGSNLVFNDISIGDVVYIDYEGIVSTSGRFYKDISDKIQVSSFHPTIMTSIDILVPETSKLHYKYLNGNLEPQISKKGDFKLYQWELKNSETLDYAEDYMPNSVDQVGYLHFSTIDSWDSIAEWYSDLVRSRIEINSKVSDEFNKLFPDGYEHLEENERAKIIYNYITSNFNYSYVSFKQSGFIPQKPAKTINTSLGDCKDFSTLFLTLANMAELESNLVLILTSDYGRNNLVLPSTDFNHCIIKVMIDGKPQYLELTNKYLPFKSLPMSLRGATALEIPYETQESKTTFDLFHLDDVLRDTSAINNSIVLNISEENMNLLVTTEINGHNISYYNEIFSEPNPEVIKNSLTDDYKARLMDDFTLNKISDFNQTEGKTAVSFKSDLTINRKLSSIGSIKILQLPIISHPYENSIIQLEERKYPIDYIQYEYVDAYKTAYSIELKEEESFVEIPESKTFKFKNHSYSLSYENPRPNKLNVVIDCKPGYGNIMPEDYKEYKAYVKGILDAEVEYIGFK